MDDILLFSLPIVTEVLGQRHIFSFKGLLVTRL